jgi:FixJ family two-component response regulator
MLISIVDDDQYAREAVETLIRSLGYATVSFQSADDFLSSGQIEETACLITDITMPGKSGFDLHRQLLSDGHQTPVIFMSAYPEKFREHGTKAGAVGFLNKPFRDDALMSYLEIALSSQPADLDRFKAT